MLKSSSMSSRGHFGEWLNQRGLLGEAVEIGTHRGDFAEQLLRTWNGAKLWCVDPWCTMPGYEAQEKLLWGGAKNRQEDMEAAAQLLKRYTKHGRCELLKETSIRAADRFKDGTLDFAFVDGDHRKEFVLEDHRLWWPKLKPGGILAGHDFIQPGEDHSWAGEIQEAVLEFSREASCMINCDVQLIVEEGGLPWSYYIVKPKG